MDEQDKRKGMDYPLESETLERARRGDPAAFGRIVEASTDDLYGLAWRMSYNADTARDLAQEAYLHLFRKIHLHEPGRPLRPWLLRVAARTMARRARRSHVAEAGEVPDAADPGPGPSAEAERCEELRRMGKAVESLPAGLREAVALYYLEDRSVQETANILGIGESAAKARLLRARERLREGLS